jgi:hypothetical protein
LHAVLFAAAVALAAALVLLSFHILAEALP